MSRASKVITYQVFGVREEDCQENRLNPVFSLEKLSVVRMSWVMKENYEKSEMVYSFLAAGFFWATMT